MNDTKASRFYAARGYPFAAAVQGDRTMSPEHARQWEVFERTGLFRDVHGRAYRPPVNLAVRRAAPDDNR